MMNLQAVVIVERLAILLPLEFLALFDGGVGLALHFLAQAAICLLLAYIALLFLLIQVV